MNEEILKLADECFVDRRNNVLSIKTFMGNDKELEDFYRAAYNAGFEAGRAIGDTSDCDRNTRALEVKP